MDFREDEPERKGTAEDEMVKEDKKKREGDERWFCEKGGGEEEERQGRKEDTKFRRPWRLGSCSRNAACPVGAEIGQAGEEGEEEREGVLAFRDPGDGFHAEGMESPK
jgi:hypothetical protein